MGEGYSDAFCQNMGRIKRALLDQGILSGGDAGAVGETASSGNPNVERSTLLNRPLRLPGEIDISRVRLVEGPDDVCAGCPNLVEGPAGPICTSQDKVARYDRAVREAVEQGSLPKPDQVCADCSWFSICRDF